MASYAALALAVQQQEGWFPGSRSYTNNNPGNLMYAGQPGAIGVDPQGFAIFPDYSTGFQALINQISLNASRGQTISQFTSIYAPAAGGNDPATYAQNISAAVGLSPSDLLISAGNPSASDASLAGPLGLPDLPLWAWVAVGVLGLMALGDIVD